MFDSSFLLECMINFFLKKNSSEFGLFLKNGTTFVKLIESRHLKTAEKFIESSKRASCTPAGFKRLLIGNKGIIIWPDFRKFELNNYTKCLVWARFP